jgi:hypothetical protein
MGHKGTSIFEVLVAFIIMAGSDISYKPQSMIMA